MSEYVVEIYLKGKQEPIVVRISDDSLATLLNSRTTTGAIIHMPLLRQNGKAVMQVDLDEVQAVVVVEVVDA